MSFEMPFISGAITRLPDAQMQIASFGIVSSISLVIESPVIGLLPTSTALSSSTNNFKKLKNFTLLLMASTTLIHILFGWSSLFDLVVIEWMDVPISLSEPTRLGMRLMVFWSAAIAWRRFTQGILIRYGKTKFVGQGTIIRLASSAGTALVLTFLKQLPGIAMATLALEAGVLSEAIFAHFIARKTIKEKFSNSIDTELTEPLTYKALIQFHWPLAATNLIFLAARPLVSTALARGQNPIDDLAVWPVISSLLFIVRAPAMALPEVVIALHDKQKDRWILRSFCLSIGAVLTILMIAFGFSPLSHFYLEKLIGLSKELGELGIPGMQIAIFLPIITSLLNFYRGSLSAVKRTLPITIGTILEVTGISLILILGQIFSAPGIQTAALALTFGILIDTILLYLYYRKTTKDA
jgi:uncharacterized membrane protein YqjE